MPGFSVRRPFTALAMLAMSAVLFTSPVAAAPANSALVAKRDGPHYPTCRNDCMVKDFDRRDGFPGQYYEHDGRNYEQDCLLTLSLSIDYEQREVCKRRDGREGYEEECLMEIVFKVDIDVEVRKQEERHGESHEENFFHPRNRDDCIEDGHREGRMTHEREGHRFDDDCLFRFSLSLDIDRTSCRRDEHEEEGRRRREYDFDCLLDLSFSLDLDLSLGSLGGGGDRDGGDLLEDVGDFLEGLL